MTPVNTIAISGIPISQDENGRYCLNDLHKAAGGESRHQPANWLRNQKAIDLIELLRFEESEQAIAGIPAIQSKQGLGTFVVKELVYAYAMWVSPEFHVHVIRTYDAAVKARRHWLEYSWLWQRHEKMRFVRINSHMSEIKVLEVENTHLEEKCGVLRQHVKALKEEVEVLRNALDYVGGAP